MRAPLPRPVGAQVTCGEGRGATGGARGRGRWGSGPRGPLPRRCRPAPRDLVISCTSTPDLLKVLETRAKRPPTKEDCQPGQTSHGV